MKRLYVLGSVFLTAAVLAACGGGGGSAPAPIPIIQPSQAPSYSVQLHWAPASTVGLASVIRRTSVRTMSTGTQTVVVQSGNGGSSAFDISDPAYVTVSVSPAPSPGSTVSITTNSPVVAVSPVPSPSPSASPAALLVGKANTTDTGHTVTASVGASSTTDNLLEITSIALVATRNGTPTAPDAIGFSFDSSCKATPQSMAAASDVYITGPDNATITFPGGGVVMQHGYDVSTLTASQWSNAQTSVTLDAFGTALDDTIIFKAANGKIVYLSADAFGGSGSSSAAADFVSGYGCLN